MKKFYLLIALVTVYKIILNGKEIEVYCSPETISTDNLECTMVDNDACWDPVYKRWEPCYLHAGKI